MDGWLQAISHKPARGVVARTLLLAIVVLAHWALWQRLGLSAAPPGKRSQAIQLRLLAASRPTPTLAPPPIRLPARSRPPPTPIRLHLTAAVPSPSAPPRASTVEATTPSSGGYVSGGADFAARLRDASSAPHALRLPGAEEDPQHRLPMADPRHQGLAGAIRFIAGKFFGAKDPHCIDVMRWVGMTREERIAHHVGPRDIAAVAARYDCGPDGRGPSRSVL
ncbi:MAG: hypothetical protein ABW154_00540 [Dyella sp.]